MLSSEQEKAELISHKTRTDKLKPSSINSYNYSRCGIDKIDQMTKQYSVKYPTRRWPIAIWYNILNVT